MYDIRGARKSGLCQGKDLLSRQPADHVDPIHCIIGNTLTDLHGSGEVK